MVADTLDLTEQQQLDALEEKIQAGLESFFEVGNAMMQIRDGRLYRERYSTWEEYCQKRWNFSGRYGHFQLAAMEKTVEIAGSNPTVLPTNESQTRPIDKDFDSQTKGVIWNRSVAQAGGVPTAKIVKEQRDRFIVEQCRYPHVQTLMNNCSLLPDRAAALVIELDAAPDKTSRDFLVQQEVRDPSLTRELVRLYREKRESFSEIRATGSIQSSARSIALRYASVSDLRVYLDERAREHRLVAQEQRNEERRVYPVSAVVWINDAEKTYTELTNVLSANDMKALQALLNARLS